ncbi:site-specific integrase [Caulobacter rhizosphaerae]|uniref:site-specific integrase n=1 Tax=Caulobacter rhizosphaerae TaxID=2010972 RepID=UPI0013D717AF|nr:site-specific integrase [Caulobacter rhizosphaerae]GGL48057.1 hypothetical protein GCM10010983_51810 [Caulobacter rhizosphaerae]
MKYVNPVHRPNGTVDLYLRKKGLPNIRLESPMPPPGEEAGSALEAEVKAAIVRYSTPKPGKGTLSAALRAYELTDPDFLNNADSTKAIYKLYLGEFEEDLGAVPVKDFTPAFLQQLRAMWAPRGYRAANMRMQVLKNVLMPALVAAGAEADPFSMIKGVRRPADADEPHILWPEAVVTAVIERAIATRRYGLARAVAIGRYVGARRGDLVKIAKAARQGGQFAFLSGKRKIPVNQPEDPMLTRWLNATPDEQPASAWQAGVRRRTGVIPMPPRTLVFNTRNQRYTESGLAQALGDVVAELVLEEVLDSSEYDLHGLRHTRGVEAALAGCSDAQGASLLGHSSPSSFAKYRRQADRLKMSRDGHAMILAMRDKDAAEEVQRDLQRKCNVAAANEKGPA